MARWQAQTWDPIINREPSGVPVTGLSPARELTDFSSDIGRLRSQRGAFLFLWGYFLIFGGTGI
jgi:hypothetical protein